MDAAARPRTLSPYDEALPYPVPGPEVAGRFAELRACLPAAPLEAFRDVVVLVSSSRGGSTLLAELLRRTPGLVTLPGELNTHVAVARAERGDRAGVLLAELAREAGTPLDRVTPEDREAFTAACRRQLAVAWPHLDVDPARLAGWVSAALDATGGDRPGAWADDGVAFTVRLLTAVRAEHPEVDPRDYDLPAAAVAEAFSGLPPAREGPPAGPVLEMAPYRLFRPWRVAGARAAASRPLVLATPRNSYRLDHLRALFPQARLRVLHLVRNPAASVNGLLDGWHGRGFFSGPVDRPLRIPGWTDAHPGWGDRWWCFDLPPGWEGLTTAALPEVAAAQWRSAHAAVLEFVDRTGCDYLRVRHEDVTGEPGRRAAALRRLADWLGVDPAGLVDTADAGLRPVMATAPPRPRRWAGAAERLAGALADPDVWALVPELGYGTAAAEWA